jgi:hypothetical protein
VSVGAAPSVEPVKTVASEPRRSNPPRRELSQLDGGQPPVDTERVARIRKAIQDGRFPIYPSTIADRLLALKLEWNPNDVRRDALIEVIEALHAEIAALKANDVAALEAATQVKLAGIDSGARHDHEAAGPEIRELAAEAHRLNETCRIYVNLMAANVRRRLQLLSGVCRPAIAPAATPRPRLRGARRPI